MTRHSTAEVWNIDHFMCLLGMWNENFVRADVNALMELIFEYNPDAVVDFWNIGACIAARASHKRLITVIQKDAVPLPSNFRHASFVPGLTMAERSDLMIHHGGYGSCQTGLFTGTPALIIPTYSERESNARRVAAVGAGDFVSTTVDVSGRKKQVSAAEVSEKVDRILTDSSFKENAKRISNKFHSYGGASYAASLIEDSI